MTAALGAWIVAWGDAIAEVLDDDERGTTTMRPRLLTWLRSFTSAAGRACFPAFVALPADCTSGYRHAGRRRSSRITRPSPGPVRRRFRCLTSGSRRCKRPGRTSGPGDNNGG